MRLFALSLCLLVALTAACSPSRGYCAAASDCDREILGVPIPDAAGNDDDSAAVCAVNVDTEIAALRANEEKECQALAAALERFYACVANEFAQKSDGCDALFGGSDIGQNETDGPCDNEFDDVQDARADINGDECSSQED
ncbi:MAG: hypothetical protein FJ137_15125 [Deltaproteobacteria bacterium]|nr:hypothetical protein [Deltaproteobacteria bacterium]